MKFNHRVFFCQFMLCNLLLSAGCKKVYSDISTLNKYLNDDDNGCVVVKTIKNISISAKYLPPSYMILRDGGTNHSTDEIDSMAVNESRLVTFILSINPIRDTQLKEDAVPVTFYGVESEAEFVDRALSMNFSLDKHVKMYVHGKYITPIAAFVENVYELSAGRNFIIVFPRNTPMKEGEEVSLVFDDPYFKLGTLQFHFNNKDLIKANNLKVPWTTNANL